MDQPAVMDADRVEWHPMMLALEGGGTRGYASLLMLHYLEKEIRKQESQYPAGAHQSSFDPIPPELEQEHKRWPRRGTHRKFQPNGHAVLGIETGPLGREKHGHFLLCHYFDYIGGTSTGGSVLLFHHHPVYPPFECVTTCSPPLIEGMAPHTRLSAIMLGRLRMSISECLDLYQDMARRVFGTKVKRTSLWGLWRSKWKASNLEQAIGDIVHRYVPQPDGNLLDDEYLNHLDCDYPRLRRMYAPDDLCKTVVFAKRNDKPDPFLFRSYSIGGGALAGIYPRNQTEGSNAYIWEAARATSAALRYLKPVRIDGYVYEDGAVVCNDPSEELLRDVKAHRGIHENARNAFQESLFLALGTGSKKREVVGRVAGHGPVKHILGTFRRLREVLQNVTTSRWVRERMLEKAKSDGYEYVVWDGGENIGDFGLDDCGKFEEMKNEIDGYMNSPERQKQLKQVAEILVKERRRRVESTPDRWQRFAHSTMLRCPDAHCRQEQKVFRTRADTHRHVEQHHVGRYIDPQGTVNSIPFVEPCCWGPWCLEDTEIKAI